MLSDRPCSLGARPGGSATAPWPPVPLPDEVLGEASAGRGVSRRRGDVVAGLTLGFVMGLVAVVLLVLIGRHVGVAGLGVGLLFALVPVLPVLWVFLWLDRYEPEPRGYLVFALVWGASVAALVAALVNTAGVNVISVADGAGAEVAAVWVAPWVEEAAKGAAVVLVVLVRRREFDGVVIGGLSGLVFAFMENILYLGRAFAAGQQEHGTAAGVFSAGVVMVLRGVFGGFAHPMFTAALGVGLGIAVQSRRSWLRVGAAVLGYLGAVVLHTVWNFGAVGGLGRFAAAYVLVMVPVFAGFVVLVLWARRREAGIIAVQLPAYAAAGWLDPGGMPAPAWLPSWRWSRLRPRRIGSRRAATTAKEYRHVATELAFLRHRAQRGTAGGDFGRRERDLLLALTRHRAVLTGDPPG